MVAAGTGFERAHNRAAFPPESTGRQTARWQAPHRPPAGTKLEHPLAHKHGCGSGGFHPVPHVVSLSGYSRALANRRKAYHFNVMTHNAAMCAVKTSTLRNKCGFVVSMTVARIVLDG